MPNRLITYRVGIEADTSKFQLLLKEAFESLKSLSTIATSSDIGTNAIPVGTIKQAASAARELLGYLQSAMNTDTGNLNLYEFLQSLKADGKTLEEYAATLSGIGPLGLQAFLKVASSIAAAEMPLKRSSDLLDKLWVTMKNTMRWQFTTSALRAFTGAFQTAYGYAQDLNESLNKIRIVTGKSTESMADFAKQANEAAKVLNTTTTEYTDASLIYYQQGLSDEEVAARTEATIKLANVAGISAQTASEQLTAIWNNFAEGSENLEHYVDVMVKLGAETASSSSEISEGLRKFSAVADTVGLSYEYAAAALATVTATTRESADIVGTAYRTLFARIQGLQLGETLDDGTDLNKYSQALAAVGVQIKDESGNLRAMDEILDDLGERWQTLAKDLQVALAETVAGVRQYTQLVALMDNWDFFLLNVNRARSSNGALQELADIYAESWEAARDRVRASAEGIYDSLINEDFFIDFDNKFLAPLLDFIENIVDGLGGMQGVLTTLGSVFSMVMLKLMAQGLRDLSYNVRYAFGDIKRAFTDVKTLTGDLAERVAGGNITIGSNAKALPLTLAQRADTNIDILKVRTLNEAVKMQVAMAKEADKLTETQYTQLNNLKDWVVELRNVAIAYAKLHLEEEKAVLKNQQSLENASFVNFKALKDEARKLDTEGTVAPLQPLLIPTVLGNRNDPAIRTLNDVIKKANLAVLEKYKQDKANYEAGLEAARAALEELEQYEKLRLQANKYVHGATDKNGRLSGNAALLGTNMDLGQFIEAGTDPKKLLDYLVNINTINGRLDVFTEKIKTLTPELLKNKETLLQLATEYEEITGIHVEATFDSISQSLQETSQLSDLAALAMLEYLQAIVESPDDALKLEELANNARNAALHLDLYGQSMETADEELQRFYESLEKATEKVTDWATKITAVGNGILLIVQMSQLAKNLGDIVSDDTISLGDKAILIITTLVAILPAFISLLSALSAAGLGPVGVAIAGIIAAGAALIAFLKGVEVTAEEAADNIIDANNKLAEATNQLKNLNDELKTTEERIKEINAQDTISVTDEEELRNLERLEILLKRLIELLEELAKKEAARSARTFERHYLSLLKGYLESTLLQLGIKTKYLTSNGKEINFNSATMDELVLARQRKWVKDNYFAEQASVTLSELDSKLASLDPAFLPNFVESVLRDIDNYFNYENEGIDKLNEALMSQLSSYEDRLYGLTGKELETEVAKILSEAGFSELLNALLNSLNGDLRKYFELYIQPAIDNTALAEVEDKLAEIDFSNPFYATQSGADILKSLVLSQEDIDDVLTFLTTSGLDLLQVIEKYYNIPELINRERLGSRLTDIWNSEWFEQLTSEDLQLLLSVNFTDDDTIDLIVAKFYRLKEETETQPVVIKFEYTNDFAENFKEYVQGILSGDITYLNLTDNEAFQAILPQLKALKQEYPELATEVDVLSEKWLVGTLTYLEALQKVQDKVRTIRLNDLIKLADAAQDKLDDFVETVEDATGNQRILLKADADLAEAEKALNDFLNAQYAIDIEVHAVAEDEFNSLVSAMDHIREQVSFIGEDFVVDAEKVRELNNTFPGIIEGMKPLKDGLVQLNQEIVQSAVDGARAEVVADTQSFVERMTLQAQLLRAKLISYLRMAEAYDTLAENEVNGEEQSAEAIATISEEKTNIKNLNDQLAANQELSNLEKVANLSYESGKLIAKNYNEAFYSATEDAYRFAVASIEYMRLSTSPNGVVKRPVNFGVNYTGATLKSEEAEFLERLEGNIDAGTATAQYLKLQATQVRILAEMAGATANDIEGMIAEAGARTTEAENLFKNILSGKGKGAGSSSKGSSKEAKTEDPLMPKTPEDLEDRYHEIDRNLEDIASALEDIDNQSDRAFGQGRLNLYKKKLVELNKQVETYNSKLKLANHFLNDIDKPSLQKLIPNLQFGTNGEILNYQDVLDSLMNEYNAFANQYNAYIARYNAATAAEQEAMQAELDNWKLQKDVADEVLDTKINALKQYEDTLDTIQLIRDAWEDALREIEDTKLQEVTYKMEVVLEIKNAEDAIRDFDKLVTESFSDSLYNLLYGKVFENGLYVTSRNNGTMLKGYEQALADAALLGDMEEEYAGLVERLNEANQFTNMDALAQAFLDLSQSAIDSSSSLLEWIETIQEMLPNALSAARARFDEFTNLLSHNTSILEAINELYELLGVTYKTAKGFNTLLANAAARLEAAVDLAKSNKDWNARAAQELAQAQTALNNLYAEYGNDIIAAEGDIRFDTLKANYQALLEEFNTSEEAMFQSATQAMQLARDMYLQLVEKAVYDFGNAVSNNLGLDFLQEKYDHYIKENERYLDSVNEAYEVATWYNKLLAEIDKTTNADYARSLQDLLKEIDLRREGGKLSQYDLDILEAKFQLLLALAAFEDAQNAKTNLRLVRDRLGNWNYQYTADPDQIAQKLQELLDAENEWYNIAKQLVEDVTGEIISTWQECLEELQKIYSDMTLTDEERAARAQEIYDYYCRTIEDLEREKGVALLDIAEGANHLLEGAAEATGLYIVDIAERFDTTWIDTLNSMTANTDIFRDTLLATMDNCNNSLAGYENKLNEVAELTGTDLATLTEKTDDLTYANEELYDTISDRIDIWYDLISDIHDASDEYIGLADSIWLTINAMRALAAESAKLAENISESTQTNTVETSEKKLPTDDELSKSKEVDTSGAGNGSSGPSSDDLGEWIKYEGQTNGRKFYLEDGSYVTLNGTRANGYAGSDPLAVEIQLAYDRAVGNKTGPNKYSGIVKWQGGFGYLNKKALGFATGGYTGEFDGSRLAFLHEKELVLNKTDTLNILTAVAALRLLGPELLNSILAALDSSAAASIASMSQRLSYPSIVGSTGTVEQEVHIEASFPNVTSHTEIEDAFTNLINDAAQWARRRTK